MTATPQPFRFGVIVLAAGASTRLGSPKQLQVVDGKPLLQRTVEAALASPAWPVVVVLGADAERIRPLLAPFPVLIAENPEWAEGMASSLRAGIAMLRQFSRRIDAALITPCDQPAFSTSTIERLAAAMSDPPVGGEQEAVGGSPTIAASRFSGRNASPALFRRVHFETLGSITGEEGARELLNSATGVVAVEMPELAWDIDRAEDLLRSPD